MADNTKKMKRHINTDIDFEFRSPVVKIVFVSFLALLLVTVALYQIYVRVKKQTELPTETALLSTVYKSVTADAVALRSESLLSAASSGTVVPMVENGSKVGINETVAKVYSSSEAASNASLYTSLTEKAAYYENISDLLSGNLSAGIDSYNNNVVNRLLDLQNCVSAGTLDAFSDAVTDFSESLTKKQIAVGENIDVSSKLQEIYSRINELDGAMSAVSSVSAQASGYYVNTVDGCENMYDMSSVQSLTVTDVNNLLSYTPSGQNSAFGKIITQFNWYLVCVVDEASADLIEVGDSVKISVDELGGEVLTMKLKAKNLDGDYSALIFSSNIMNSELATLRFSQVKIRLDEHTGFAVNKKAVRTVDGEVGVYIQLGNMVRFRKINIIYTDESIVLAENTTEDGYLKLYDEIITEGVDYDDGKIIT